MEYIRISKDDGSIKPVSLSEIIDKTEGAGYWKKGTVEQMLNLGEVVFTPLAFYRAVPAPSMDTVYIVEESNIGNCNLQIYRNPSDAERARMEKQQQAEAYAKDLDCDEIPTFVVRSYKVL